ncbi:hypothetical protein, partial [Psychrobacter arenosus]|uniref:hypothetical protein n=1 Tax=Psychrobacter arenosus TaxID=256326 RepID=UPI0039F04837
DLGAGVDLSLLIQPTIINASSMKTPLYPMTEWCFLLAPKKVMNQAILINQGNKRLVDQAPSACLV